MNAASSWRRRIFSFRHGARPDVFLATKISKSLKKSPGKRQIVWTKRSQDGQRLATMAISFSFIDIWRSDQRLILISNNNTACYNKLKRMFNVYLLLDYITESELDTNVNTGRKN